MNVSCRLLPIGITFSILFQQGGLLNNIGPPYLLEYFDLNVRQR